MSSKKERNHYDLKEMEKIQNAKIVSIPWHHNVLTQFYLFIYFIFNLFIVDKFYFIVQSD